MVIAKANYRKQQYNTQLGPGQYNYNISTLDNKGNLFCKNLREGKNSSQTPGPGQYSVQIADTKKGVKFLKNEKFLDGQKNSVGPGQYNPSFVHDNRNIKFPKAT